MVTSVLGELKGLVSAFPNKEALINSIVLQEAKESCAIENIKTSQVELFSSNVASNSYASSNAKLVHMYAKALEDGNQELGDYGVLLCSLIQEIQSQLIGNDIGFRKNPGTVIMNALTREVIYRPPQDPSEIINLMNNLEEYINDDSNSYIHPLVNMAVIHHQFESIHPFHDGNGRTGRIINSLYLVKQGLLDYPVLYLSRSININRQEYYRLLQAARNENAWEDWVLYMLHGVLDSSDLLIKYINDLNLLIQKQKNIIRTKLPKIYSKELLNALFCMPFTRIEDLCKRLNIHRNTATSYLTKLVEINILTKEKYGKSNNYINVDMIKLIDELSRHDY